MRRVTSLAMVLVPCKDGEFPKRFLSVFLRFVDEFTFNRLTIQDAHNCIINYDTDTSLFAVYDGHGGHEVAAYCAENLPEFLKKLESYKSGDIAKALEEAYLEFDHQLTKEDVIKTLHCIAGNIDFLKSSIPKDTTSYLCR